MNERRKQAIRIVCDLLAESYSDREMLRDDAETIVDMAIQIGRDEVFADVKRFRERCNVRSEDAAEAGLTPEKARAWMLAHGWSQPVDIPDPVVWLGPNGEQLAFDPTEDPHFAVMRCAWSERRSPWDVLSDMAAMNTELTDEQARGLVDRWAVHAGLLFDLDRDLRMLSEPPDTCELTALFGWVRRECERKARSYEVWVGGPSGHETASAYSPEALADHIATKLGGAFEERPDLARELVRAATESESS